ncbi:LysR substrate-binding domain-containing protein [Winogradskyella maritima]|nr:LysR substrate-binding domain-containing protein [Winogradskyella maritima]
MKRNTKPLFFLRKRNSIELTENGQAFLVYVNRILELLSEVENQFLHQQESVPSLINFGASTTIANHVVPEIIAKFRKQHPQTTFEIKSENSEEIEQLILNQQIDFGITEGTNTHKKLQYHKFIKDEIVLVTGTSNTGINKIPFPLIASQTSIGREGNRFGHP